MLEVGCWRLEVGYRSLRARSAKQDVGCWSLRGQSPKQDFGAWSFVIANGVNRKNLRTE